MKAWKSSKQDKSLWIFDIIKIIIKKMFPFAAQNYWAKFKNRFTFRASAFSASEQEYIKSHITGRLFYDG